MVTQSNLRYKAPTITIVLNPHVSKQGYPIPLSTVFVPQPEGYSAVLPDTISPNSPTGTGVVPADAGSAPAAGSNVAAGGAGKTGTFGSTTQDPGTVKTYAEASGIHSVIGYSFKITTSFSPGMSSSGATAVLYSDIGTPTWAGTSVPLNGSFRLDPLLFTPGDVLRVRVTPAAPYASLVGYSNEIPFTSAGVSFKRVSRTNMMQTQNPVAPVTVVNTTNYIWFAGVARDSTQASATKLFRMNKSTELVEQMTNITSATTNDNIILWDSIGDVVFFTATLTGSAVKLYSITETGVWTVLSNLTNNTGTSDTLSPIIQSQNGSFGTSLNSGHGILTLNNNLYFVGRKAFAGIKVYRVNGSGTITQVTNTTGNQNTSDTPSQPTAAIVFNGNIYIGLSNSSSAAKLFKITSADVVTEIGDHRNLSTSPDSPIIRGATTNFLYYSAQNTNNRTKLYRINTSDVPSAVVSMENATTNDNISAWAVFNECLYFLATYSTALVGPKMFKIDDSGTVTNIASPIAGDLDVSDSSPSPTMQAAGSILLFSMASAERVPLLFYVTTASDTVKRFDQLTPNPTGYQLVQFAGSFTLNGRTFVQMTANIVGNNSNAKTLYEVTSTPSLRQLVDYKFANSNGTNDFWQTGTPQGTSTPFLKAAISSSTEVYFAAKGIGPGTIGTASQYFVCKMTLT